MPAEPPCSSDVDDAHDLRVATVALHLVALATHSEPMPLQRRERGAGTVGARHLALYLLHVGLGWPLERVSRVAARSRSTISRACQQVEDRRDRAHFDQDLAALEAVVRDAAALTLELT